MEMIKVIDPNGEPFEVAKTKLAKLISKGWKLADVSSVILKPAEPDVVTLETVDPTPVVVLDPEPVTVVDEDESKDFVDDGEKKASSKTKK